MIRTLLAIALAAGAARSVVALRQPQQSPPAAPPAASSLSPSATPGAGGFPLEPFLSRAEYSGSDEEAQRAQLPPLPPGMTLADLVLGDEIFHGKGGCYQCHGNEGTGKLALGSAVTVALLFVDPTDWDAIFHLVSQGLPDAVTRSPVMMPARGAGGRLDEQEVARVAAYIWAIGQTRGEPWPGGHPAHSPFGSPDVPRTDGP